MHRYALLLLVVVFTTVHAGPLNLFVNVTIDDRPDLDIVDGDIAYDHLSATSEGTGRNAYIRASKWPGGLLPYVIDGASPFTAADTKAITDSMRKIEQQTNNCIRFVRRTNQPAWVRIYSGTG